MRGKMFIVLILVIMILMCIPYAPGFGFSPSKQSKYDTTPEEELEPFYDTDGDLLSDSDETKVAGTNPDNPDSDGDGFPDGEEFQYWSERYEDELGNEPPSWLKEKYPGYSDDDLKRQYLPTGDLDRDGRPNVNDPDSDGDGRPDGMEVKYELDPGDPDDKVDSDHPFYKILKFGFSGTPSGSDSLTNRDDIFDFQDYYLDPMGTHNFQDVVFKVDPTKQARYWRLTSYSALGSSGWQQWRHYNSYQESDIDPGISVFEEVQNHTISIDFNGLSKGILPVTLHTTKVFDPRPETVLRLSDNEVLKTETYIDNYSFNMTQFYFSQAQLLAADTSKPHVSIPYLLKDELGGLASEIVDKSDPPFLMALDIAAYLRDGFRYDIVPHEDYQTYDQYLVDFLKERKVGSCTEFSSAFVILCQLNDINARFVAGFTPGEIDEDGDRVVKIGNAHSWAEVYLTGLGWIPFEVSPPASGDSFTTGVGCDGNDPSVVQLLDTEGNYKFGGTGGGATGGQFSWSYYDLIHHPTLDTDNDGTNNSADSDDDGDDITDQDELLIGTDPLDSDTDSDGLSDGEEYFSTSTSPLNGDTDNDGLRDGKEFWDIGSDPKVADTDGGGLDDGDEVYLGGDPLDDSDDQGLMDSDGDGLNNALEAKIGSDPNSKDTDSGGANDMVEYKSGGNVTNPKDDLHYLDSDNDGLSDADEILLDTNRFDSDSDNGGASDGDEMVFGLDPLDRFDDTPLLDNDRDGLLNYQEDALGTDKNDSDTDNGGLDDLTEVEVGLDPLDPDDDQTLDSDKDGLSDVDELTIYRTDPYDEDSDGDGLSDGNEVNKYGTDPNTPDTDNDGISDKWELSNGLDPLKMDTDGDHLSDYDEIYKGTNPNERDTDGDGIWDNDEIAFGTDPFLEDTDWDGVPDSMEIDGNTDPTKPDSDFDGDLDFSDYPDFDWDPDWINDKPDGDDHMIDPDDFDFFDDPKDSPWSPTSSSNDPPTTSDPTSNTNTPDPPDISPPDPNTGSIGLRFDSGPVLVAIIALVLVAMVYMSWRKKHIDEVIDVMEEAERVLEPLTIPDDIRAAIFQTYEELQNILRKYEFIRRKTQTPREFKKAITEALPVPEHQIEALTSIFEEARYSNHQMTITSKNKALESFRAIKESLRSVSAKQVAKQAKASAVT